MLVNQVCLQAEGTWAGGNWTRHWRGSEFLNEQITHKAVSLVMLENGIGLYHVETEPDAKVFMPIHHGGQHWYGHTKLGDDANVKVHCSMEDDESLFCSFLHYSFKGALTMPEVCRSIHDACYEAVREGLQDFTKE